MKIHFIPLLKCHTKHLQKEPHKLLLVFNIVLKSNRLFVSLKVDQSYVIVMLEGKDVKVNS